MTIQLSHNSPVISKNQYRRFTRESFFEYVKKIASDMGVNMDGKLIELFTKTEATDGALGRTIGFTVGNNYEWNLFGIEFRDTLLDGETFTLSQINEVIKHEFCHVIANTRNKKECGHNDLWKSVCEEYGCMAKTTASYLNYTTSIHSSIIANSMNEHRYVLKCDTCHKTYYQNDLFDSGILKFFLLCTCGLDLVHGDLPATSTCCHRPYCYEADVDDLITNLKDKNIFPQVQNIINKELISTEKIESTNN